VPGSAARSALTYNLGRLGLFVVCVVLGYVAGLRSIWLLVAALLVSGVLSYFLLARQRMAMASAVTDVVTRSRERMARRTAEEDAYAESLQEQQSTRRSGEPPEVTRPGR
jgi:hypothetical protein